VEERVRHRLRHRGIRDQVVVARVDQEVMDRLEKLVQAGIFQSRSEAAAMLLREALRSRERLFEGIEKTVSKIQTLKEGLREMAREEFAKPAPAGQAAELEAEK
jgi:Arc/MetJ-type ribon-helix-helix transcriptional regulator